LLRVCVDCVKELLWWCYNSDFSWKLDYLFNRVSYTENSTDIFWIDLILRVKSGRLYNHVFTFSKFVVFWRPPPLPPQRQTQQSGKLCFGVVYVVMLMY